MDDLSRDQHAQILRLARELGGVMVAAVQQHARLYPTTRADHFSVATIDGATSALAAFIAGAALLAGDPDEAAGGMIEEVIPLLRKNVRSMVTARTAGG